MNILEQPSLTFKPAAFLSGTPGVWAAHLPFACDLVAALKPQMIVELGVHYGDSYFGFCQAVEENQLTCTCYGVDRWRVSGKSKPGRPAFAKAIYDAVNRHNDRHYRSFSYLLRSSFDDATEQFSEQSIALLHLNGACSYEAAANDFQRWLPKVRPGGVILLHNIAVRSGDCGVWRLWEELQNSFPNFSFRHGGGLGVLWKPEGTDETNGYLRDLFFGPRERQERIRTYYALCAGNLELQHRLGFSGATDAGHSLLEVFRLSGGEYQEDERFTDVLEPGKWVNVFLSLPEGLGDGPLRIDPSNRTAVIDIESIVIRKVRGKTVWSWNAPEHTGIFEIEGTAFRLPSSESLRILSFGNEPQLYLPELLGAPFDGPLELEIRIRIDLEMSALQHVTQQPPDSQGRIADTENIELLKEQFEETKADLEQKYEAIEEILEKRIETLEETLEQQRRANNSLNAERERERAAHKLLSQELAIARGNVEELKGEIEHLAGIHGMADEDVASLRKANARLTAALQEERALRESLEQSLAWRMTEPLRKAAGVFSQFRKSQDRT
jgi:archaellum component FlaC